MSCLVILFCSLGYSKIRGYSRFTPWRIQSLEQSSSPLSIHRFEIAPDLDPIPSSLPLLTFSPLQDSASTFSTLQQQKRHHLAWRPFCLALGQCTPTLFQSLRPRHGRLIVSGSGIELETALGNGGWLTRWVEMMKSRGVLGDHDFWARVGRGFLSPRTYRLGTGLHQKMW